MNKLDNFAVNPFLTVRTSKNRFGKFVIDHTERMKSHDNPSFVPLINSTEALYEEIFGNIGNHDKDSNLRQSLTIQVNQKILEFKDKVLEMESLVIVKYKKNSATYKEFYPRGRTEYYRINKKNILLLFERILNLTSTYETDLGSDWKTDFELMYDDFKPVFGQQSELKGAVSQSSSDYKILKNTLCHQLYKNLLILLAEYNKNPKKALTCFDETIVNWRKHPKKEIESESGK